MRYGTSTLQQLDLNAIFCVRFEGMSRVTHSDIETTNSDTVLQGHRYTCKRTLQIYFTILYPFLSIGEE